jgi:hypothetical protein
LLLIEKPGQILTLVQIKEVEWRPDIPAEELDVVETPGGLKRCILRDTGYSVEDVLAARAPWSRGYQRPARVHFDPANPWQGRVLSPLVGQSPRQIHRRSHHVACRKKFIAPSSQLHSSAVGWL